MTFWKNMPHRMASYSFQVEFGSDVIWMVKSIDLPKFNVESFTDLVGLQNLKTSGTATWEPITVEIYDIIGLDDSQGEHGAVIPAKKQGVNRGGSSAFVMWASSLNQMRRELGFDINNLSAREHINYGLQGGKKSKSAMPAFDNLRIRKYYNSKVYNRPDDPFSEEALNIPPDSQVVEEWRIINPQIIGFDMGSLDATSEETNTVKLVIQYDKAEYYSSKAGGIS